MKAKRNEAKERLRQIRVNEHNVENLLMELEYLKSLATKVTASISSDGGASGHGASDKLADSVLKIIAKEDEINTEIKRNINERNRMIAAVNGLKSQDHSRILYLRYIKYMPFAKIADEMNYSKDWIFTMHGRALQALERSLNESGGKDESNP